MRTMRALQLSLCTALLFAALGTSARADSWDRRTIVTLNDSVEIPGQILPPGTYVFKLLNSPSNRHIVQIFNEDETQVLATIMTVPIYRDEPPNETVFELDERPYDSPQALRAWFYPGDNYGNEFVYR
jgi:hypothetical protein